MTISSVGNTPLDALLTALTVLQQHANDSIHSGKPMSAEFVATYTTSVIELVCSDEAVDRYTKALTDAVCARALLRMPSTA
jgi:hypothetical protein